MTDTNLSAQSSSHQEPSQPANIDHESAATDIKKVTIHIAGKSYSINCPANEEAELRAAVFYINNFVLDIKQDAPQLNQENLLVLCCLNLYEKIHEQQQSDSSQRQLSKEADLLLDKILKDAESMVK